MNEMNHKLSEDIRLAIGDRSYEQVATATGISKATLSRMINQTYKRVISPSLLWKLSVTAHNDVTFELLMHDANFTESETARYRSRFENGGHNINNESGAFINNAAYSLLANASGNQAAFTHEITLHEDSIGELKIAFDGNQNPSIYIIDGADLDSVSKGMDRRICELLGRCVLASENGKYKVAIVTSNRLLFDKITPAASVIVSQVILVNVTGETFVEKKGL